MHLRPLLLAAAVALLHVQASAAMAANGDAVVDLSKYLPSGVVTQPLSGVDNSVQVHHRTETSSNVHPGVQGASFNPSVYQSTPAELVNQPSAALATVLRAAGDTAPSANATTNSTAGATSFEGLNSGLKEFAQTSIYSTVVAIILIITGITFVFYGQSMLRTMIFITGFYTFGLLSYGIVHALESRNTISLGSNREWIVLIIFFAAGIVGGLLFQCIWTFAVYVIGALLGIVLAAFILQFPVGVLAAEPGRYIFFGSMALLGAVLVHLFQVPIVIVSTAVVGSASFFVGIDRFAKTGFGAAVYNAVFQHELRPLEGLPQALMLGGFGLVALLGIFVQFVKYHAKHTLVAKKPEMSQA
ncbi:hypothetical protein BC831DRAFT_446311 [Entophlyctis helioformis]|nr:hypothetical protein BC831DRAFT_446311 [Entophlyctis helioformis]